MPAAGREGFPAPQQIFLHLRHGIPAIDLGCPAGTRKMSGGHKPFRGRLNGQVNREGDTEKAALLPKLGKKRDPAEPGLVGQTVSALCAAARKHLAAIPGRHSFAEAVLFGALALLRLVSPQHFLHLLNRDSFGWAPAQSGGGLPRHMPLSIRRCNTEYIMRDFSTIVKQETRKNANFLPARGSAPGPRPYAGSARGASPSGLPFSPAGGTRGLWDVRNPLCSMAQPAKKDGGLCWFIYDREIFCS